MFRSAMFRVPCRRADKGTEVPWGVAHVTDFPESGYLSADYLRKIARHMVDRVANDVILARVYGIPDRRDS
jgi:hypothetical protein